MDEQQQERFQALAKVRRGLVDHDDHEPEDLERHLIEEHGWSASMVAVRTEDNYPANWHDLAHGGEAHGT